MRDIYLHGALGKKYGKKFTLDVLTAAEAVRALCANFPEMMKDLRAGAWHVVRGKSLKSGFDLGEGHIFTFKLGSGDLHIAPFVAGSKNGNAMKIIIGVALVAVSFGTAAFLGTAINATLMGATTWGNAIGMIGLSMAATGISGMLAPEMSMGDSKDQSSYIMTGPSGTSSQGAAVPIVYGRVITGGVIVSNGLDVDQIGV